MDLPAWSVAASDVLFVAVATLVLSRSRLMRPFRIWLSTRSEFLYDGIMCTFCTSFWLALITWLPLLHHWRDNWQYAATMNPFVIMALASPIIWLVYTAHKHSGGADG